MINWSGLVYIQSSTPTPPCKLHTDGDILQKSWVIEPTLEGIGYVILVTLPGVPEVFHMNESKLSHPSYTYWSIGQPKIWTPHTCINNIY